MSDWYKSGRDNDPGRYGAENRDRERRDFGAPERWRNPDQQRGEPRSFDERRGYGGQGFSGPDFTARDAGYRSQGAYEGMEDERRYGGQEDRSVRYSRPDYRARSYDETRHAGAPYGAQGQAPRFSPSGQDYGQRYDQGAVGRNPPLQRIADGDTDPAWRANLGAGEHRGRGPKNYVRSDERIREDVNDRLSDDSWLDASEVEVMVKSCEVTLTGTVQSREDKRRAEDLVERVSGVKHVQNNLRVEPHPTQNPRMTPMNAGGSGPVAT